MEKKNHFRSNNAQIIRNNLMKNLVKASIRIKYKNYIVNSMTVFTTQIIKKRRIFLGKAAMSSELKPIISCFNANERQNHVAGTLTHVDGRRVDAMHSTTRTLRSSQLPVGAAKPPLKQHAVAEEQLCANPERTLRTRELARQRPLRSFAKRRSFAEAPKRPLRLPQRIGEPRGIRSRHVAATAGYQRFTPSYTGQAAN